MISALLFREEPSTVIYKGNQGIKCYMNSRVKKVLKAVMLRDFYDADRS